MRRLLFSYDNIKLSKFYSNTDKNKYMYDDLYLLVIVLRTMNTMGRIVSLTRPRSAFGNGKRLSIGWVVN